MNKKKQSGGNSLALEGKRVALTGATGGIGGELCRALLKSGAHLVMIDRNPVKAAAAASALKASFPCAEIENMYADLEDIDAVKSVCIALEKRSPDILILNAGAYSIPRRKCKSGYDNVFQINFVSQYYMARRLLPCMGGGHIVAVGSIAHNYSRLDENDIDFGTRHGSSLVYGNSKRFLMFSLYELFKNEKNASLSIAHPGITFTNITSHYPKVIFALIKYPMKVIFMRPGSACKSILRAAIEPCRYQEWIGPEVFNIWGRPAKKKLKTCSLEESRTIGKIASDIYDKIK